MNERRFSMKKVLLKVTGVLMAAVLWLSGGTGSQAAQLKDRTLEQAYTNVMFYAEKNGIDLNMTFNDFLNNYEGGSVALYEQSYYSVLRPDSVAERIGRGELNSELFDWIDIGYGAERQSSSSSSSSNKSGGYYYNTGTSCPSKATYSKYKLLSNVKKGDIIFEAAGGFGITGHIAIVEGIYTRSGGGQYIRVIEAIDKGVVRSILDDTRIDERKGTVLRVKSASTTTINRAVSFCVGELGSKYNLDFAKDTSSAETDWYCSELVWAAYKNQGIDIEVGGINEPGITPRDIKRSNKVSTVSIN